MSKEPEKKLICKFCGAYLSKPLPYCTTCNNWIDRSLDPNIAIEAWKTIINLWDSEANRFWTRNNIFLLLNAGLIAFISTGKASFPIKCTLCFAGAALAIIWCWVSIQGKKYLNRWKPILQDFEERLDISAIRHIIRPEIAVKPASTKLMQIAIVLFFFVYIVMFSFLLYEHKSTSQDMQKKPVSKTQTTNYEPSPKMLPKIKQPIGNNSTNNNK